MKKTGPIGHDRRSSIPGFGEGVLLASCVLLIATETCPGRQWTFDGVADRVDAKFVAESKGYVVLQGPNDKSFELPLASFNEADREFIRLLGADPAKQTAIDAPGEPVTRQADYKLRTVETLTNEMVTPEAASETHLTGVGNPLPGSWFHFTKPDGWLFFDRIKPSTVAAKFLDRFMVNGAAPEVGVNLRLVQYGPGTVVIPQPPDFPALMAFADEELGGKSVALKCWVKYGDAELGGDAEPIRSFVLKRGYMATLAEHEDGTGASRNYVAQDHDVVVRKLPQDLGNDIRFVRVFPWRWSSKKGIAGNIHDKLNVGWFYNWNISKNSSLDLEYVAIKQNRHWPGLGQDWRARGVNHLLGFNEPDRPDQANMSVDQAIKAWPGLLKTGLRLGSPATSDGGLSWLYQFIDKADRAGLRVDFVPVHYYRAVGNPGDERAAAAQMKNFLQKIHDRVKRPLWVTEWNNGANWTKAPDPNPAQQQGAISAMIEMMDETDFVERYALFNWVEACRELVRKDGSLTPAGEVYRDQVSPAFFVQPRSHR